MNHVNHVTCEHGEEHCSQLQGAMDDPDLAERQKEQDDSEARYDFSSISGNFVNRTEQSSTHRKKAHAQFRSNVLMSSGGQIATLDVLQESRINDNGIVNGEQQPGPNENGQKFGRIGRRSLSRKENSIGPQRS